MIRSKNETDDLLHSKTKNCENFTKQIHSKEAEALKFKLTKPRETVHFNPPIIKDLG